MSDIPPPRPIIEVYNGLRARRQAAAAQLARLSATQAGLDDESRQIGLAISHLYDEIAEYDTRIDAIARHATYGVR